KAKVLIAIDSFKGSISSLNAARAIKEGIHSVSDQAEIEIVPIADGGEGTVEAVIEALNGQYIAAQVHDPLMRLINARYGVIDLGKTAIIEMAAASGLTILKQHEMNPLITTSFGTGEQIVDAIKKGSRRIILGLGGSATNDGGIGMAAALGFKFYDGNNIAVEPFAKNLSRIERIDLPKNYNELKEIGFIAVTDVTNPLLGINGASYVYGPQKGADESVVKMLDESMKKYSEVVEQKFKKSISGISGSGAAGGLGFASAAFLNAEIINGIDFITTVLNLEEMIMNSDVVITGEGRLDDQTRFNKVPFGVAKLAKKYDKKVIAVAGIVDEEARGFPGCHFDKIYSIVNEIISQEDSMQNTRLHLHNLSQRIAVENNL
ncbi:MAG: glycerate kinase, partial [Bacteroidota bacterium]